MVESIQILYRQRDFDSDGEIAICCDTERQKKKGTNFRILFS